MERNTSIAHLQELDALLKMEFDYETAAYNRSLSEGNISGRTNEPDCKYPVTIGGSGYNTLNQLIVTVVYDSDEDAIDNDFEPGSPVSFFYIGTDSSLGDAVKEMPYTCFVDSFKDGVIQIQLPNKAALMTLMSWSDHRLIGVRVSIDGTSYRVMHESLHAAMHSVDDKFVQLREVLSGNMKPRFRHLPPVTLPWLNDTQNDAVRKVLAAMDVAVVHGPPGTGKTTTLIEAVIETLQRETQVLVCAPSNAAVDWISEQLSKRGVGVLRIGNPLKMSDEMLACSYERRYADHTDYPELWNIRRTLRESSESKNSRERQNQLRRMRKRQTELEIKINADLFNQASVVSCTLIGSSYHIMEHRHFGTLFIDVQSYAFTRIELSLDMRDEQKATRSVPAGPPSSRPTVWCWVATTNSCRRR